MTLAALLLLLPSCLGRTAFQCQSDGQCASGSDLGVCQPTGFCSFADDSCDSGQRYGNSASSDLGGVCVDSNNTPDGGLGDGGLDDGGPDGAVAGPCLTDVELAGGQDVTCALDRGQSSLWCWGRGIDGELGQGSTVDHGTPQRVGLSNVATIAVGEYSACAAQDDGSLWCWGRGNAGQLGAGSYFGAYSPVLTAGPGNVTAIGLGFRHSCAATSSGAAYCWGENLYSQVGDETLSSYPTPTLVDGVSGVTQIGGGEWHSCALTDVGTVYCWGRNNWGQLGNGLGGANSDDFNSPSPVQVNNVSNAVELTVGGYHACARIDNGDVYCWGYNQNGEIGDSSLGQHRNEAVKSTLSVAVAEIHAGRNHTCARTDAGAVHCWGYNKWGQVGDGSTDNRSAPVTVAGIDGVVSLGAGGNHTCAAQAGDQVVCWGYNATGQIGNGRPVRSRTPIKVANLTQVSAIAAGDAHSCAVDDGTAYCWGENTNQQIANPSFERTGTPTAIGTLTGQTSVWGGTTMACAGDGASIKCWGNHYSVIGANSAKPLATPTDIAVANPDTIVLGWHNSCAINNTGALYCWGENNSFVVNATGAGAPNAAVRDDPAGISTAVSMADHHGCAIVGGKVYCFGFNNEGRLGDGQWNVGPAYASVEAVFPNDGETAIAVVSGSNHTCALRSDATVWCWGFDTNGQCGDGPGPAFLTTPTEVTALSDVAEISARQSTTCARTTTGAVYCWGHNGGGQLGTGTDFALSMVPVLIEGITATAISVGAEHVCAIDNNTEAYCWGANRSGQLGDGSEMWVTTPTASQLDCSL